MKLTTSLFAVGAVVVSVYSAPVRRAINPSLVPDFGLQAGLNPTGRHTHSLLFFCLNVFMGTGCDGINGPGGQPIIIPCSCPPDRESFIAHLDADVAAGRAVNNPSIAITFPEDNSVESQIARITAVLISLQNLDGPGIGCPAASTTLQAQQKALQDGTAAPPASALADSASNNASDDDTSTDGAVAADGVDPALVPDFGVVAGTNPSGTGDCDGINGPDGNPILIPCACPPERESFVQHLSEDVSAGFAVNNPDVKISFPTDGSVQSQIDRITAVVISLQNLNGPGQGCPAAATTLLAQQKALQDGSAVTPSPTTEETAPPTEETSTPVENATSIDSSLVPDFGIVAGTNPSGTGDCDGIDGPDGNPILIPCACPPERDSFIQHLSVDVGAGFAVNNPDVKISFPVDDSVQSQIDRITAVVISLQNLNGPGQGCPAAATTLLAQSKALQAQL